MKKYVLTLFCLTMGMFCFAQSPVGLIAHWDMNGTVNDVTGNGHNGHAANLVPATGISGVPNTAYYFNGLNSLITAPYMPDLNVTQFSICATFRVAGFWNGLCQTNFVFDRGSLSNPGNYTLYFYDNPYDGNDCSAMDTTKDVLVSSAGLHTLPDVLWCYTPTIVENKWYKVVTTWDGTKWQMWVNGSLKTSNVSPSGSFGTSTDSISIGRDIFDCCPGNFKV